MTIKVKNLSKSFKEIDVFSDLSFSIKDGTFLSLIGENGSGKSTLLKLLSGVLIQDSGIITFTNNSNIPKKDIVFISSNQNAFFLRLTPYENIKFFLSLRHIKLNRNHLTDIADEFDITDEILFSRKMMILSDGMKKKISIIIMILSNPKYIFLDEIENFLDYKSINALIRNLNIMTRKKTKVLINAINSRSDLNFMSNKFLIINKKKHIFGDDMSFLDSYKGYYE